MRRLFLAAWLIVCCAACRGTNVAPRARLRVAAAADLNAAFGEIASRFESSYPVDVDVTYGSSGTLYSQLANEAPFDLFFSADVDYPQRLARAGLTLPDGAFEYGVGRLVVWVAGSSPLDVAGLGVRALSDDGVRHVAIANPAHAPYGRAAIAALTSEHLDARVAPKLVYGENVGQALQFVQSGAADAGIVALSLALTPAGKSGRWFEIPQADYPPLRQGGAILKWAVDPAAARALRDLVVGAEGRSILQRYGFSPPAGQPPAPHVT